jgi:hypothetical protein
MKSSSDEDQEEQQENPGEKQLQMMNRRNARNLNAAGKEKCSER